MATPETLKDTFAQAGLTFRVAWAGILIVVWVSFMYLTGQSRFWASLGLSPQDGQAALTDVSRVKDGNFYRFSIGLHGQGDAPTIALERVLDDWRYNLDIAYEVLSKQNKTKPVPIKWMSPRWGDAYVVEIAGVSIKKAIEVFDILAYSVGGLAPFVLLVLAVRVGFFKRPDKYKR